MLYSTTAATLRRVLCSPLLPPKKKRFTDAIVSVCSAAPPQQDDYAVCSVAPLQPIESLQLALQYKMRILAGDGCGHLILPAMCFEAPVVLSSPAAMSINRSRQASCGTTSPKIKVDSMSRRNTARNHSHRRSFGAASVQLRR